MLLPCRVGRTARAGAKGRALTFIEDGDRVLLKEVGGSGRLHERRAGVHGCAPSTPAPAGRMEHPRPRTTLAWPAYLPCLDPPRTLPPLLSPVQVIKRTGVQMQQRAVPQVSVDSWQQKVERLEPQVESILWEEREEKALRKAEMEVQKVGGWKARTPAAMHCSAVRCCAEILCVFQAASWPVALSCCPAAPGKLCCSGTGSKPLALPCQPPGRLHDAC